MVHGLGKRADKVSFILDVAALVDAAPADAPAAH
jgi:hypothetical protein